MDHKVNLNNYNNDWYSTGASPIKRLLWYFTNIIFFINPLIPFNSIKISLLRFFGAKVGEGVTIKPNVNIKYPWLLEIGSHTWIGEKVWIDNLCLVRIGNHVCISQGALLLTGNHNYKSNSFDLVTGEIVLEDGVWIGARAVVCPGVICKSHSILTVGSVTSKDLEPFSIYQGIPATFIRNRVIEDQKMKEVPNRMVH